VAVASAGSCANHSHLTPDRDNHASTSPLSFYRPDALPAAQPTMSKHWRNMLRQSTCILKCYFLHLTTTVIRVIRLYRILLMKTQKLWCSKYWKLWQRSTSNEAQKSICHTICERQRNFKPIHIASTVQKSVAYRVFFL